MEGIELIPSTFPNQGGQEVQYYQVLGREEKWKYLEWCKKNKNKNKMDKEFKYKYSKKDIQIAIKYTKLCSTLLDIKEMHIKPQKIPS